MRNENDVLDHEDCAGCREYNELSRRQFITDGLGLGAMSVFMGFPSWLPKVVLAESFDAQRDVIVSIFQRGGADGLSLCVPWADANYYTSRPTIAIARPDAAGTNKVTALDTLFGLPPAMLGMLPAYQAGQLLIVHATGSIDPSRSHFDAQRFMEVGKPRDPSLVTGWLGRHLASVPPMRTGASLRALGYANGLQKTLVGAPQALPINDPANFGIAGAAASRTERTNWLRADFASATEPLQSSALDAMNTIDLLQRINFNAYVPANGAVYPNSSFGRSLRSTAALIKADIGVEAVAIDIGGWDTHTTQGPNVTTGSMYRSMQDLSNTLGAFHADVIAGTQATNVTLVVMSEFGRNVRENSGAGTDHGRGSVMFAMGRNVSGGRVLTNNWPGLARENQADGQDLKVTLDHRDVLAEVVQMRLGNTNLSTVFPNYTATMRGVCK
jgi:uncharacterized protein (DUF1501 family)